MGENARFAFRVSLETCSSHCNLLSQMTPKTVIVFFELISVLKSLTFISGWSSLQNNHTSLFDLFT
jgi:hypothetical protein